MRILYSRVERWTLIPRQYSPQFLERVLSLLQEGREVVPLARELGISSATIYRWLHQSLVDAGLVAGTTSADAAALSDAKRRIRQLEEELKATSLAASMLRDEGIGPNGTSR